MEDSRIVDLYLGRDESAVKITQEKYGKNINGFAKRICGDETMADECENDTYLGAWNSIPPHEPRSYLYAFLLKITRGLAINRLRHAARQKRSAQIVELSSEMEEVLSSRTSVESEIDGLLLGGLVSDFLLNQNEEKRYIFLRRYWFMDPVERIAQRMGFTEGKIKTTLFRMRKELKKYLQSSGYEI